MIEKIIAYENGELSDEDTVALFQELINNGQAWTLQGHYGRTVEALINAGHCVSAEPPDLSEERLAEVEEKKKRELDRYFCK